MDVDLVANGNKEYEAKRDQLNDELIGTLTQAPVIVVQGVEIKKPSWFREPEVDLDQMMQQMGSRRNR